MCAKRKVTYTFYTDSNPGNRIDQMAIARQIRVDAITAGEKMASWARELGVSRQFVYQVVDGARKNERVRDFIENRLGKKYWDKV